MMRLSALTALLTWAFRKGIDMGKKRRLLTNSTRNTFTSCHRKFELAIIQRLEAILRAPPLAFGSLIHSCVEDFYNNHVVLHGPRINAWLNGYCEIIKALEEKTGEQGRVDTTKAEELATLAKGMMMGYVDRYAGDLGKWKVLACELQFRYPLPTTCPKCNGTGCAQCNKTGLGRQSPLWDYGGIQDLLIADERDTVWVVEHKTTVLSDLDQYALDLGMDMQPRGYLWAARQWCKANGHKPPVGVLYNIMRKKIPATPATTQCKRCKGKGETVKAGNCLACAGTGVGGISKSKGIDTTLPLYLAAIKAHSHLDINHYEDQITMLQARGDRFFKREYHYVSDREIVEWLLETHQIVRDIGTCKHWYRDLTSCNVNGRKCQFRKICLEDSISGRANFRVRESEHPELERDEDNSAEVSAQ